ncbi:Antigen peptide transporter 2 [Aphelenchoides fujianensis]|nr:Antigen peptide transporter 2 [Aphelenchoides fujianensis]
MTTSSFWLAAVPVGFGLLDWTLSLLFLGFFHAGWGFDSGALANQLAPWAGYDFRRSGLDFLVLSTMRLGLMLGGLFGLVLRRRPVRVFHYAVALVFILTLSYTQIKILAFAENDDQMRFPGTWLSVASTFLFATVWFALWFFYVRKRAPPVRTSASDGGLEYEHLPNGETPAAPAANGTTSANGTTTAASTSTEEETKVDRQSVFTHVSYIMRFAAMHWNWFLAGFVFLMIYSVARIFIPYYTGHVIAEIVDAKGKSEHEFVNLILIMMGLTAVSTIFGGFRGGAFTYATALVSRSLRRELFRSIVRQEIAFFDVAQTGKSFHSFVDVFGEILSRLTSDCSTVSNTVSTNINVAMRNSVMLIGSLVFMTVLSWRLTLITFIAIPPIAFITKVYGDYFDRISEKTQTTIAEANRAAEEVVSTMRTVRSFACEMKEADRFDVKLDENVAISRKKAIAYTGYTWLNELSENLILVSVLFYAGHLAMKGQLTVNQATSFLLYQMQLGENFYSLNYVFSGLMEAVGASRKVFEYMSRVPKIKYEGTVKDSVQGNIRLEAVHFAYPTRATTQVLKNVSLDIPAGQTVAFVGPSGAGKSSIIALLEHFYESNQGHIFLDGVEITKYDHAYYHQQVSLVSQEPVLYSGSVRYNILYGCEEWANDDDMIEAAKLANAHNFITEMEAGYETKCGEKGVQMSGIAIARALVRKPSVLILDEATSALDSESEHIIQEALKKCSVGRTVIVIAHRLSTVENADRIFVINKGCVVQSGNHRQLMTEEGGLYQTLVQRQLLNSGDEHTTSTEE